MREPLSPAEIELNRAYYRSRVWQSVRYRGVNVFKYPTDLWMYQEIISSTMPEVIVETGTAAGGSALYFRDLMRSLGLRPSVVSIDLVDHDVRVDDDSVGITFLRGDSASDEIAEKVHTLVAGRSAMVSLDSNHERGHVARELELYSSLVPLGCYLVVEDTSMGVYDLGADEGYTDGTPWEATMEFLQRHLEFVTDNRDIRHRITANPYGWLVRTA